MPHENLIGEYLGARRELIHPEDVGVSDLNRRRRVLGAGRVYAGAVAGRERGAHHAA